MSTKPTYILITAVLTVAAISCTQGVDYIPSNHPEFFVDADGSHETTVRDTLRNRFPHLKMADGQMTLNDRCPVRKVGLNRRLPVLFVNALPIGFC